MDRIVRDIEQPHRRSIRDIKKDDIVREGGRRVRPQRSEREEEDRDNTEGGNMPPRRPSRGSSGNDGHSYSRLWMWSAAVIGVLAVLFAFASIFNGATVQVEPTNTTLALNGNLVAKQDAQTGELQFDLAIVDDSYTEEIPATGEREVNRKASGTIIVYNAYSSEPQKLIKNTRFATPEGLIYRTPHSITVPGTTVEGGEVIPGSVEVDVYADLPGEEYNVGLTDFTIPGLKGDERYDSFYARSKTEMTGGFSGVMQTASEEDIATARQQAEAALKEQLRTQSAAAVPNDFILYNDAIFYEFDQNDIPEETTGDTVKVTVSGTLYGVIFDKGDLSTYIAENNLAVYENEPVMVTNLEDLSFEVLAKDTFTPLRENSISFTLEGDARLVWEIDTDQLKQDLVGAPRDSFPSIVENYDSIKRAEAAVRPFWEGDFPDTAEKITIDVASLDTDEAQ